MKEEDKETIELIKKLIREIINLSSTVEEAITLFVHFHDDPDWIEMYSSNLDRDVLQ